MRKRPWIRSSPCSASKLPSWPRSPPPRAARCRRGSPARSTGPLLGGARQPQTRTTSIGASLIAEIARVSGFPEDAARPGQTLAADLGFDSIMLNELVGRLTPGAARLHHRAEHLRDGHHHRLPGRPPRGPAGPGAGRASPGSARAAPDRRVPRGRRGPRAHPSGPGAGSRQPVLPHQRRGHAGHLDHRRRRGRQLLQLQLPRHVGASGGHRCRPGRRRPLRQLVLIEPPALGREAGPPGARGGAGGAPRRRRRSRLRQRARHQRHRDRAHGRSGRPRHPRRPGPQQHRAGRRAVGGNPPPLPAQRRRGAGRDPGRHPAPVPAGARS